MLTFYCTVSADYIRQDMPDIPVLVTATSFWRRRKEWGAEIPDASLPAHLTQVAVDAGGFVATRILGDYPFGMGQYVRWLQKIGPQWAATMDFCCEDEITSGKPGVVRARQRKTTYMAWLADMFFADVPWRWLPTIQGWTVEDYQRHARDMRPLLVSMRQRYGDSFVVGIGTLCRRASVQMIREVIRAVAWELPGFRFHLWGIKLGAIESGLPDCVASCDSAAWHISGSFASHKAAWHESGMSKRAYEWHGGPLRNYLHRIECAQSFSMPLFGDKSG